MNSDFFYLAYWQQQLLVLLLMLFLFLFSYFYFVSDVRSAAQQQKAVSQERIMRIELLQYQLTQDSSKHDVSFNLLSENKLTQLLLNHRLILQKFKYDETENTRSWDIELGGFYSDFINLMNTFINDYDYLDFEKVSIIKIHEKQLLFVLKLYAKKEKP